MTHPRVVNIRSGDWYDVLVARPSKWGNPYRIGQDGTRAEVIAKYAQCLARTPRLLAALPELRGKRLGCWCAPADCHADVLALLANDGVLCPACGAWHPPTLTDAASVLDRLLAARPGGITSGPNLYKTGQPREEP